MRIPALVALALLSACASSPDPAISPKDRLVVLISVDGLPADAFKDPKISMPTMRRLAEEGATSEGMRCSFPTVTWPNHTTLVTGVHPARHGVLANSYFDREAQKVVPLLPDPLFDKEEIVKPPTGRASRRPASSGPRRATQRRSTGRFPTAAPRSCGTSMRPRRGWTNSG